MPEAHRKRSCPEGVGRHTGRSGLRLAAAVLALALLGGCASPSGGLPPSFAAGTPLPGEIPSVASGASPAPPADAPLTDAAAGILFIADFGGGPNQQEIADAMLAWKHSGHRVDAVVTAGDNVYPRGQESGFVDQVQRPYSPLEAPLVIALGNHDVQTAGGKKLLEFFDMPAPPSSHRFGPVEVFVMDSNRVDQAQALWLDEKLSGSDALVRVVVFHHPVFSCGPHGSTAGVQRLWLPVIEEWAPELVVNGHDHNYQRMIAESDVSKTVYTVAGGGGRELTGARVGCDLGTVSVRRVETRHHFLSLEVATDGRWVLRAVTANATVFDHYEGSPNPRRAR